MKKLFINLFVIGIAVGSSAFSEGKIPSKSKFANWTFVHPIHGTDLTRPSFIYDSTPGSCDASENVCKAVWSQSTTPAQGSNPASNAVLVSIEQGDYVPDFAFDQ